MKLVQAILRGIVGAMLALSLAGCETTAKAPPTTAPAGASAIPAAASQRASTLADLTGGQLGVGGGFLIGAAPEKVKARQTADAVAAAQLAEQSPATLQVVRNSTTADLNHDGYVTLDEVLAMVRSGLSDSEVNNRLGQTHYIFHVTPEQERYLTDRGVSQNVVATLQHLSNQK